jgi:hypothetical protein
MLACIKLAEMALVTLQGAIVPETSPPFALKLSHSPMLPSPVPPFPLFPQFVHSDYRGHPLLSASAQDLFKWFRSAGPLAEIGINVDVGRQDPVCVVQYWDEDHARYAQINCRKLHMALEAMPAFTLRTYDPCNLYCAVRCRTMSRKHLVSSVCRI